MHEKGILAENEFKKIVMALPPPNRPVSINLGSTSEGSKGPPPPIPQKISINKNVENIVIKQVSVPSPRKESVKGAPGSSSPSSMASGKKGGDSKQQNELNLKIQDVCFVFFNPFSISIL